MRLGRRIVSKYFSKVDIIKSVWAGIEGINDWEINLWFLDFPPSDTIDEIFFHFFSQGKVKIRIRKNGRFGPSPQNIEYRGKGLIPEYTPMGEKIRIIRCGPLLKEITK